MEDDKDEVSIGEDVFLSLGAAADKFVFNLKYLTSMVQKGKLKAFKMGDVWYTCEKWINDHKKQVVDLIDKEIREQEYKLGHFRKWVRKTFK